VPIFVNSPMAVAALAVYREAEGRGELRDDIQPEDFFNLPNLSEITDAEDSKALNHPDHPSIVISSSGMATGGRVLHHLEAMLPDQRNCVIFTGYQGVGTRGRTLLNGVTEMKFRGRYVPVKAEIVQDGEFSVHADASDLVDWLRDLSPKPETVFVTHGEEGSSEAFAAKVRSELGLTVVVPRFKEKVNLTPHGTWAPLQPASRRDGAAASPDARPASRTAPSVRTPPADARREAADRTDGCRHPRGRHGAGRDHPRDGDRSGAVPAGGEAGRGVRAAARGARPRPCAVARPRRSVREGVNLALYAAAGAVETPGGQSIVALLAHVPKVLG
jgi:hypothetical protein